MSLNDDIILVISEPLLSRGYEVIKIDISYSNRLAINVFIDRLDALSVSVTDCSNASKLISALLDVENIINNSYVLNVSSPGAKRPLTKPEHFSRFVGSVVVVELFQPISGRKKFTGTISAVKSFQNMSHILLYLEAEQKTVELPFCDIKKANLRAGN